MSINNCVYCRGAGLTEVGFPRHRARHRSSGEWLPEERGTEEAEEGEGPREAVGSAQVGGPVTSQVRQFPVILGPRSGEGGSWGLRGLDGVPCSAGKVCRWNEWKVPSVSQERGRGGHFL